jgi:hypothetical protein
MEDKLTDLIYTQLGLGGLLLAFIVWTFFGLSSELAKLRTEVGYEINRDLLTKRFEAYGALWARMQRVAIYTGEPFGRAEVRALERDLSDWYFSTSGGLLLTAEAREYYFALQDTVRAASDLPAWCCQQRSAKAPDIFVHFLKSVAAKEARTAAEAGAATGSEGAQDGRIERCVRLIEQKIPESMRPGDWRHACLAVAREFESLARLETLEACEEIYCAVQQVSSILRTRLAFEVRSRLAVKLPA